MAQYPDDFTKAVDDLIDNWEGGYVDDPKDPGGETKYGISRAQYPKLDIKDLTRDQAIDIYYRDYWLRYKLDEKISDPAIRAKCFNMGVLMGPLTALAIALSSKEIDDYRDRCKRHFELIVQNHPEEEKFLKGWLRRAAA